MSKPERFALEAARGADAVFLATLTADAAAFSRIEFTVRDAWVTPEHDDSDADALVKLTLSSGIVVNSARELLITVPAETFAGKREGAYPADLKLWAADGRRHLAARGSLLLSPTATASP